MRFFEIRNLDALQECLCCLHNVLEAMSGTASAPSPRNPIQGSHVGNGISGLVSRITFAYLPPLFTSILWSVRWALTRKNANISAVPPHARQSAPRDPLTLAAAHPPSAPHARQDKPSQKKHSPKSEEEGRGRSVYNLDH